MDSLSRQLELWSQRQLTGCLEVRVADTQRWFLHCRLGRLVWAGGGLHPLRRWRRFLGQFHPQLEVRKLSEAEEAVLAGREYDLLVQWVRSQQILGERAANWVRSEIAEVLFDILQQEQFEKLTFIDDFQRSLEASLSLVSAEQALQSVQQTWKSWSKAGLANLSPNLAPRLQQPELLKQQIAPQIYEKLVQVVDGERTLRDVAVLTKQSPVLLARTLVPYIRKGMIRLFTVPDLSPTSPHQFSGVNESRTVLEIEPRSSLRAVSPAPVSGTPRGPTPTPTAPLVACIDDSRWECLKMEHVVTLSGYRFIGIQDSVQALPTILEQKPDLIFLDLIMPIVSGYELCMQLRRVSQFRNTPIVILTGNDGMIDRVRAKLSGATEFVSKPIDIKAIEAVLLKHCPLWS